jgi:hypothetical protein
MGKPVPLISSESLSTICNAALQRLLRNSPNAIIFWRFEAAGAKALAHFAPLTARLKPCPCYKIQFQQSFVTACPERLYRRRSRGQTHCVGQEAHTTAGLEAGATYLRMSSWCGASGPASRLPESHKDGRAPCFKHHLQARFQHRTNEFSIGIFRDFSFLHGILIRCMEYWGQ